MNKQNYQNLRKNPSKATIVEWELSPDQQIYDGLISDLIIWNFFHIAFWCFDLCFMWLWKFLITFGIITQNLSLFPA